MFHGLRYINIYGATSCELPEFATDIKTNMILWQPAYGRVKRGRPAPSYDLRLTSLKKDV